MKSRKLFIVVIILLFGGSVFAQFRSSSDSIHSMSLLFAGDIMGHMPQIYAAYDTTTRDYRFDETFRYVKPVFAAYDFVIANLETTLAGKPYSGYPQFSSPDALALACKHAGISCLATANNHCCDRGKKGLVRTISTLDSLGILHFGTYSDSSERNLRSPVIFKKNNIQVALYNYTFSTNGIPVPEPLVVNFIDTTLIARDIAKALAMHADKIIIFVHWDNEYQSFPDINQKLIAAFCFSKGADIIIGSHPHVIQPAIWEKDSVQGRDKVVVYSLGNYVSNQRKSRTDGGMMTGLILQKENGKTVVKQFGHYLTWVYTPVEDNRKKYYILPCSLVENDSAFFKTHAQYDSMKTYMNDARKFLDTNNVNEKEYIFIKEKWEQQLLKQNELNFK